MNQDLQEVFKTKVPTGMAAMWWLGQMGLLVKMGETVICIDYFASNRETRQTPVPIPAEEMMGIDAFLGTHDHLDHIDHDSWEIWARTCPAAKFIFPRMHQRAVLSDGIDPANALGINAGETIQVGDVKITAVAAAHEFLAQDPVTGLYPALQYIIEGNGVRIHHAGDTLRYEGMLGKIRSYGRLDAELLPINGRDGVRYRRDCIGNMTYQESVDFAAEVGTRMVIPGHWDMFADNSADPEAFADYLDAKYPGQIECKIPKVLEKIIVGD